MTFTFEERTEELAADEHTVETFTHADGSQTFVQWDEFGGEHANPREDDGNLATLVSTSRDYLDLDSDDAGLTEAVERLESEELVRRYVAMFRPDIAYYAEWQVQANNEFQSGFGYVTTEALHEAGLTPEHMAKHGFTPAKLFAQEVETYRQYFAGEVYSFTHVTKGDPIVVETTQRLVRESGMTVTTVLRHTEGHAYQEESVYGFLGYETLEQIAAEATDSPVLAALEDVSPCAECGHLHYVHATRSYVTCPLAAEGCTCEGQS